MLTCCSCIEIASTNSLLNLFRSHLAKKDSFLSYFRNTALTRPMPADSTASSTRDNLHSSAVTHPNDDSSPTKQHSETPNGTRRLRVSFSDFDKIQYFDDHSSHHHYRHRSSRRTAATNVNNYSSTILIPHSDVPHASHRLLSRQQPVEPESSLRKQSSVTSPPSHTTHSTYLPDVLRQPLPTERPMPERYTLRRERPFLAIPEPANEVPIYSSAQVSRESTRMDSARPVMSQDAHDQNNKLETGDRGLLTSLSNSSISSLFNHRQRSSLRSISLRQQFTSPTRFKTSPSPQLSAYPRRSNSLNHSTSRANSSDYDLDDISSTELLSAFGHRPMTSLSSSKQSKRNYIVHFDSKRSLDQYASATGTDPSEANHASQEPMPTRFQSVLKLVRSPYLTTMVAANHGSNSSMTPTNTHGRIRSPRTSSDHVSPEFHSVSNTIFV